MGARPAARNFRREGAAPKLGVTASRLAPGPDVRTGGRHLPPLPGELHASGNGGSCSTKRGASGHSRRLDRDPTWGDPGLDVGRPGKGPWGEPYGLSVGKGVRIPPTAWREHIPL